MDRRVQLIALFLTLGLLLVGAIWVGAYRTPVADYSREPTVRKVVDMTGQTISLTAQPKRILSLCTSATDTIIRLGAQDRLAAIDEYSRVVPGTQSVPVIGKGSAVSREQLVALNIDLAFIWWFRDDAAAVLRDLAIPVVRIRSVRAGEVPKMLRLVGECLEIRTGSEELAGQIDKFLARVAAGKVSEKRRVFLEMYSPYKTLGGDTFINDLLELAGGSNIAAETKGTVVFSVERLVEADPDVILFVGDAAGVTTIAQRSALAGLRSVRGDQVLPVDRYLLVAGAGLPQAVEKISGLLFGSFQP